MAQRYTKRFSQIARLSGVSVGAKFMELNRMAFLSVYGVWTLQSLFFSRLCLSIVFLLLSGLLCDNETRP
jgi:hypothetical protein